MTAAPWWVTLIIGVLTVVGAFFAAQRGAKSNNEATLQREKAAAREEWFRRLQWAGQMALHSDRRTRSAGYAMLSVLADSPLATQDDLKLLLALGRNEALDVADHDYDEVIGTTVFTEVDEPATLPDDGDQEQEGPHVD